DRQGMVVGDILAQRLGWKLGDTVVLQSYMFAGDCQFKVDAIYTATARSVDRSTAFVHWAYLNDSLPAEPREHVGWIVSRADDPRQVAALSAAIDKRFESTEVPTLSQDERAYNATFISMFSAILRAMDLVSGVILVIMTLILGNTIAMSVRERTNEY